MNRVGGRNRRGGGGSGWIGGRGVLGVVRRGCVEIDGGFSPLWVWVESFGEGENGVREANRTFAAASFFSNS